VRIDSIVLQGTRKGEGDIVCDAVYSDEWIKVEVKFTLEQATKAQRGSRGISLLFL
jgi:hypothetical protein